MTRAIPTSHDAGLGDLALAAARAGAEAANAELRTGPASFSISAGDPHGRDPVTAADLAAEAAIRSAVERTRPQDAWLTEESGASAGTTGVRWIVDPLDGTVNAGYGISRYAVSVAAEAEECGTVLAAAVVLLPWTDQWLVCNGETVSHRDGRARVSNRPAGMALVSFAVPAPAESRRLAYRALAGVAAEVRDLRNLGSTVSDLADVAMGRLDAFVSFDPKPWDVAAGVALVRAAGGTCRRWRHSTGMEILVAGGSTIVNAVHGWLRD